jgi:hypothetical protein
VDERRTGKTGMGRWPTLLKSCSVAWDREEKGGGGGRCGRVHMEPGEGGEGGGVWHGGRQLRAAGSGPRPSGTGDTIAT